MASDAVRADSTALGNPMAQAILERLKQDGVDAQALSKGWVLKDELSFDVKRKLASYVYQYGNSAIALIQRCTRKSLENSTKILLRGEETPLTDELRAEVVRAIAQMAHAGERLLAFGYHRLPADQAGKSKILNKTSFLWASLASSTRHAKKSKAPSKPAKKQASK